ncbi:MAG: SOS response-associated peptidase family protein [Clostridia bacterium]|nr:SOS response-associated peptidase family protein [Clostridia bacterium]
MCCRYLVALSPELRPYIEAMNRSALIERFAPATRVVTEGEVYPANAAPVLATGRDGKQRVYPMKWGFSTGNRSLLINARTETAAEKPLFRESWKSHRCMIPAVCYYEWEHQTDGNGKKKTGDKYRLQPAGESVTWLCGLYRMENGIPCFVVLTREPGESIRFIHDRMPLILPESAVREWIRPEIRPESVLDQALTELQYGKTG